MRMHTETFREGSGNQDNVGPVNFQYRIHKMWVEPKWNSNTFESDSMIVTKESHDAE